MDNENREFPEWGPFAKRFTPRAGPVTPEKAGMFKKVLVEEFDKAPVNSPTPYGSDMREWRASSLTSIDRLIEEELNPYECKNVVVDALWYAVDSGADNDVLIAYYTMLFL